jgi:hypothetical protein
VSAARRYWLASYPKSGNTWFRILVANLGEAAPVDINNLAEGGGIASARAWFDSVMLFPSGLLTHDESEAMRPLVYGELARHAEEEEDADPAEGDARFVKTHDAYVHTASGAPLMGGARGASGAILVVRDPRDVAISFANHNASSIDAAIALMGNPEAALSRPHNRQHDQLRQRLMRWCDFNASWLDQTDLPVHLVRYEDMLADTAGALRRALAFAGRDISAEDAAQAAAFADFGQLRQQEEARGFREKPLFGSQSTFFRRGIAGAWRDELTAEQAARIEADQGAMMARLGYGGVTRGALDRA